MSDVIVRTHRESLSQYPPSSFYAWFFAGGVDDPPKCILRRPVHASDPRKCLDDGTIQGAREIRHGKLAHREKVVIEVYELITRRVLDIVDL